MTRNKEILISVVLGSLVVVAAMVFHHLINEPDCFARPQPAKSAK